jgi:phytoene/squalene synthetase
MEKGFNSQPRLAETITWTASKQTYHTVRFLADRERMEDAYRTYAYFRWVDDCLDSDGLGATERVEFVERQRALMDGLYRGQILGGLTDEERMLVRLVQGDREPSSGLQAYIRNMMAVMVFDAYRRGRLVSQKELNEYTRWLATAVTEAMHYFIGHCCASPKDGTRYLAVTAAHIVHMLRDTHDDVAAGYFNIPREVLEAHKIDPDDITSAPYRQWVRGRVQLARHYFDIGTNYLTRVQNPRCRLAGYAYTVRFTGVLDAIEKNDYVLQPDYPERRQFGSLLRMGWSLLGLAFHSPQPKVVPQTQPEGFGKP